MAERERIACYFAPLAAEAPGSFNLADDAALLTPPRGHSLVVTTDSVIESIHVMPKASPQQFAQKLVRRNLSDLAAMGAVPWHYTLNLHTPRGLDHTWFAAFAEKLAQEQTRFGMVLVGGDSTTGDSASLIHATLNCFGLIEGQPLRRNAAKLGDDLYVSGTIGDAALALQFMQQKKPVDPSLNARYYAPEPRLALGQILRGIASAAIDVSDGLIADIGQLCTASNMGARLTRAAVPRSSLLQQFLERDAAIWELVLQGGDDYELAFCAPQTQREKLQTIAQQLQLPLTRIGEMVAGSGVQVYDETGAALMLRTHGWEHD